MRLAYAFAAIAIGGALAFAWHGVVRDHLVFRIRRDARSVFGVLLIGYAAAAAIVFIVRNGTSHDHFDRTGIPGLR